MVYDLYWIILIGCVIYVPRYFIYRLNPKDQAVLQKRRQEMVGVIKWTFIFSAAGFLIVSVIAILHVVFGESFYDTFRYYDEFDDEVKSNFFTYRSMFFVAIGSYIWYVSLGGKFELIFTGKFIDEPEEEL